MLDTDVIEAAPFVRTMTREPAEEVLLLMLTADPVVNPLRFTRTIVVAAVIEEFVKVKVKSDPPVIDTPAKVARPDLPLTTTGLAATPEADGEFNKMPAPDADVTMFPRVAVTAPVVAVKAVNVPAAGVTPPTNPLYPVEAVRVVNDPAPGVVPPIAPGAAKRAVKEPGLITTFVVKLPVTASAFVANRERPSIVVVASGINPGPMADRTLGEM